VVRCGLVLAPGVAGPDGAVGFRCSPHPTALALARAAEAAGLGPLTATSLNKSGRPPAATRADVRRLIGADDRLSAWLAGEAGGEMPSTVVDATGPKLVLLRAGAIPKSALGIE
jgi:tRNA A37 threonylcarbamoyladenosine synthetase subunit TsaC/SUA5/YrdC